MNSRIKELYTNRERHNIIHLTEIMKTFLSEHMITDHEKVQPSRSQVIAGEKFLIENKALIDAFRSVKKPAKNGQPLNVLMNLNNLIEGDPVNVYCHPGTNEKLNNDDKVKKFLTNGMKALKRRSFGNWNNFEQFR